MRCADEQIYLSLSLLVVHSSSTSTENPKNYTFTEQSHIQSLLQDARDTDTNALRLASLMRFHGDQLQRERRQFAAAAERAGTRAVGRDTRVTCTCVRTFFARRRRTALVSARNRVPCLQSSSRWAPRYVAV